MAKLINAYDDPKVDALAILTIRMDSGKEIANKVLKTELDTPEKMKNYLLSLEKAEGTGSP